MKKFPFSTLCVAVSVATLLSFTATLRAARLDDPLHTPQKPMTQKQERDFVLKARDAEMRRIQKMVDENENKPSIDASGTLGKPARVEPDTNDKPLSLQNSAKDWQSYKPSSDPFGLTKNLPVSVPPGGDEVDQFMVPFAVKSAHGGFNQRKSRTAY